MKSVLIDIDGVIADNEHRKLYLSNGKLDMKHFLDPKKIRNDKLMSKEIPQLLWWIKSKGIEVILLSARYPEQKRETINWLERHHVPYDRLIMRDEKQCYMKDHCFKREILMELLCSRDVILAIDDMKENRDVFCKLGIPIVLCKVETKKMEMAIVKSC